MIPFNKKKKNYDYSKLILVVLTCFTLVWLVDLLISLQFLHYNVGINLILIIWSITKIINKTIIFSNKNINHNLVWKSNKNTSMYRN